MGWMQALCETYDNYFKGEALDDRHPLAPVGFTQKELHIRVNLLPDGSFHSAAVLEERKHAVVPSCPEAEGRTGSKANPYPLCEELRYVAKDLSDYSDKDYSAYYEAYRDGLRRWCDDAGAPQELKTLLNYLERGRLTGDLIRYGVLFAADGRLLSKWPERKNKPAFFSLKTDAAECIMDFSMLRENAFVPLREMPEVQESWQRALSPLMPERQLCYVTGEMEPSLYNHPKIGNNAKLISSKDGSQLFQYKGRFTDKKQVYSVGYAASAKAHNALRWLQDRQGFRQKDFGATFIAWSTLCRDIVEPREDAIEGFGASDEDEGRALPQTEEAYAHRVNLAMAGYKNAPAYKKGASIVMLGMEAATQGRMSLNFYQELDGSEYLERLNRWYTDCFWLLQRQYEGRRRAYVATPTLSEIGSAVFGSDSMSLAEQDKKGEESTTKQIKSFNLELLSCIINARPAPVSAARSAFRRACRPQCFTNRDGKWQRGDWLACLAVTCALEKSSNKKEEYSMSLNRESCDTGYLFGRLAAVADCAEIFAMSGSDNEHRQTNAIRYFSTLQQRPGATWAVLEIKLQPYLTKLRGSSENYFRALLDEIEQKFKDGELAVNQPLTPHFLEGYHNQRYAILNEIKENRL